ncbi:hypothetical protein Bca52824_068560 [Brassica carinata]|uniref:Anther-specific protein BCP1 n=1 Tax=Brassica carinata TaxID=52824 RepID=A0A8X7U243_BRACI|nr:hypothetical protein Bca52824_068560 [Brassica carinata]
MARLHLALLLLFVVVVVSAVDKPSTTTSEAPAATTPTNVNVAEAPGNDNAIGKTEDKAAAATPEVAESMGSDSSNANYPPPQQASGNDATATVGFVSVAAATVGSLFFFFLPVIGALT